MMKYTQVCHRYRKCPIVVGKRYKIKKIISDNNYFANKTLNEVKSIINTFVDDLIWLYENEYCPTEGIHETVDMYKYELSSEERLLGELRYISDRWSCAIRIRLMIDLVRPNCILKNRKIDFVLPYNFKVIPLQ